MEPNRQWNNIRVYSDFISKFATEAAIATEITNESYFDLRNMVACLSKMVDNLNPEKHETFRKKKSIPTEKTQSPQYIFEEDEEEEDTVIIQSVKSRKRRRRSQKLQQNTYCHECKVTTTPEWRTGPNGPRTLCNACGLHWAKFKKNKIQK